MKINNFNKFGDTCYRVQKQIVGFVNIIEFIKEELEGCVNKSDIKKYDMLYKQWASDKGIYEYGKSKIGRFNIIISILTKKIPILHESNNKLIIDSDYNNNNNEKNRNHYFFKKMQEGKEDVNEAFIAMLDFINNNQNIVFDTLKLFKCFAVYDGKESFDFLYKCNDVIEYYLEEKLKSMHPNSYNTFNSFFSGDFVFRKPPTNKKFFEIIFNKKYKNEKLNNNDLNGFDKLKEQYFVSKYCKNYDPIEFINKINKDNIQNIARNLLINKLNKLLEDEYYDLFWRFMNELGIFNPKKEGTINTSIIKKITNKSFELDYSKIKLEYPFSQDEVNEILSLVNNNKYDTIRQNIKKLAEINNPTIAEYFVNLSVAYKLNLSVEKFKESCNTSMSELTLLPIFTASGGQSDFLYTDTKNNVSFSFETTILSTVNSIIKSELFPCIDHIKDIKTKNTKLFLVIPTLKKINDKKPEIEKWFIRNLIDTINNYSANLFKVLTFDEIKNLNLL